MKNIFAILLSMVLLTITVNATELYVDLNKIETDTTPEIVDGRIHVPVRAIFESLGADVKWDNETRTAIGTKGGTVVRVQIDNTTAYVNDEVKLLDVPAQIINNRTMVPARFISEALDCKVTWYEKTSTASVADKLKNQPIYVTQYGKHYHFNGSCNGGKYYEADLAEAMGRGLTPCDKCVLTNEYYQSLQKK
ncbi:MAG: copper amine oxidase N-terminal domain-containing protein [Firmicutes bacterium]|nr:copper amine oxidase N-terminal domain-containing protein [Bacillota bacterium]